MRLKRNILCTYSTKAQVCRAGNNSERKYVSAVLSLTAQHARVREGLRLVRFILGNVILDTWRCGVRMMGGVKKQRADHLISQRLNVYCCFLFVFCCCCCFIVVVGCLRSQEAEGWSPDLSVTERVLLVSVCLSVFVCCCWFLFLYFGFFCCCCF